MNKTAVKTILPMVVILSVYLLAGCMPAPAGIPALSGVPASAKKFYENAEGGISLERPSHWDLEYTQRNNRITLEAETGDYPSASARIELWGSACHASSMGGFDSVEDEINTDMDRIRGLYYLDAITRVQDIRKIANGKYEIAQAAVAVPTEAMTDDEARIEVGAPGPGILQTIVIYTVTLNGDRTMAHLYKGNDEALNAEAEEIIKSIRIACPREP